MVKHISVVILLFCTSNIIMGGAGFPIIFVTFIGKGRRLENKYCIIVMQKAYYSWINDNVVAIIHVPEF